MAERDDEPPRPPDPPPIGRRLDLGALQLVGLPLLLALPVLALLGTFGERSATATARAGDVRLDVHWPTRTRHERIHRMDVVVRNVSTRALDTVTVAIDTAYLAGFSAVSVTPGPVDAWRVELAGVGPGEARRVAVEMDASRYGRLSGHVTATAAGADTARVAVSTLVFP